MKKTLALFGMLIFAIAAFPQCQSGNACAGTITAAASTCTAGVCVSLQLPYNSGSIGVTVTGTFVATLQFEVSSDGQTWTAANATPPGSTTAVTSATSTGVWVVASSGMVFVRVRGSAYTSGTASVNLQSTVASAKASGAAGGGGAPTGAAGGDLGSTYPNPTVLVTHLSSPLPVAQGGTGSTTSGSGALVLVEAHTASSSATLDFTTCISATYDSYLVQLVGLVPATNATNLFLTFSTDGGSTFASTNYQWADWRFVSTPGSAGAGSASDSHLVANNPTDTLSNSSSWGLDGNIFLYNPGSASLFKRAMGDVTYFNSSSLIERVVNTGAWGSATAVNAFRFAMSSGNIASGTIRCYGVAH